MKGNLFYINSKWKQICPLWRGKNAIFLQQNYIIMCWQIQNNCSEYWMHRQTPDWRDWNIMTERKYPDFFSLKTELKLQVLFTRWFQISFNSVTTKMKWGKRKRHLNARSLPIRNTWLIFMINKSSFIKPHCLLPSLVVGRYEFHVRSSTGNVTVL